MTQLYSQQMDTDEFIPNTVQGSFPLGLREKEEEKNM